MCFSLMGIAIGGLAAANAALFFADAPDRGLVQPLGGGLRALHNGGAYV